MADAKKIVLHRQAPERVMTEVTVPRSDLLEDLWDSEGKPHLEKLQEHLFHEGRLKKEDVLNLVKQANAILKEEPNVLEIQAPIAIAGDTHGQFYDLLKLFEVGGDPKSTQYLFLGDYVDRGLFSIEVILLLFAAKIIRPKGIWLLRGNHECRHLTDHFTFKEECLHKYDIDVYEAIILSFQALPLAGVVNGEFLCIHGGISPCIMTIDDIRNVDRFMEPPQIGVMCDLLWADPMEEYDEYDGDDLYFHNDVRSCSYVFTYEAACLFLNNNNLRCIIRAHEAQDEGYKTYKAKDGFPSVITLFSAPNYLDAYGNKGAIMVFDGTVMNIRQFEWVEHPYWLPNFMDVFTWSIPFVAEKVTDILVKMMEVVDDLEDDEEIGDDSSLDKRKELIRAKIRAIGRMRLMFGKMREKNVTLVRSGSDGTLDLSCLDKPGVIGNDAETHKVVKQADKPNEKRPDMDGVKAPVVVSSPKKKNTLKDDEAIQSPRADVKLILTESPKAGKKKKGSHHRSKK